MPNIKTFDAGNLRLNPTETGVDATAKTAQRIGMFFNQQASGEQILASETERLAGDTSRVGSETETLGAQKGADMADTGRRIGSAVSDAGEAAVQYLEHRDISQGSAGYAKLFAQTTQQWNDTIKNADPNDPTVASKFMGSIEDSLTKFKEDGFVTEAGQKWAEAHVDALRQHLTEKASSDMATMAGQAAVVNQQQTINSLSATVHGDPSSLDFSLAALKSSTEGMISSSPNLTGTQANAARSEILQKGAESIVKSAAIGYIEKTGTVPAWATDPKYSPYINGAELKQFESAAKTQTKVNDLTSKQAEKTAREIADQQAHAATNKTISDNVTIDPQTGRPVIDPKFYKDALDIVRKNPDAPTAGAAVRTMIQWGESQQNKEAKIVDDPATKQALTDRLFDPDHPTTRIDLMKAQVDGKLSNNSFTGMERLVTELEKTPLRGDIWKSTTAAVRDRLIRADMPEGRDPVGAANYSSFMQDFIPKYLAKSRDGTLPPNALNLRDPSSMISQSLEPYKSSMQDRLRASSQGPAEPAPAEKSSIPESLRGIASLSHSKSRNLYRDDTTGKIYNADGTEVKK